MAMMDAAKRAVLHGVAKGVQMPWPKLNRVEELSYLRRLIDLLRVDCVLDVGANKGQFASELRQIGFGGVIVSFEPIPREFQRLQAAFADDRQWIGQQIALGSADSTLELKIPTLSVMSSLLPSIGGDTAAAVEMVAVRRLDGVIDGLLQGHGCKRLFLKMDTQGYDVEVFNGAAGCRDRIVGLQSELSIRPLYQGMPHYLESLSTYEAHGFSLYNLSVVNRVPSGALLELNCFMQRQDP